LAADIGGTKSSLWLFEHKDGRRHVRRAATLRSAEHSDACAVVQAFLGEARVDAGVGRLLDR